MLLHQILPECLRLITHIISSLSSLLLAHYIIPIQVNYFSPLILFLKMFYDSLPRIQSLTVYYSLFSFDCDLCKAHCMISKVYLYSVYRMFIILSCLKKNISVPSLMIPLHRSLIWGFLLVQHSSQNASL